MVAFGTDFQSRDEFEDVLAKLMRNYNTTVHSAINMKPAEVTKKDEDKIRIKEGLYNVKVNRKIDLKVGDTVRYALSKKLFDKGHVKFSKKTYQISKSYGKSYELEDDEGNAIKRRKQDRKPTRFKHWELQKINRVAKNPKVSDRPQPRPKPKPKPKKSSEPVARGVRKWWKKYLKKKVRKKFDGKFYKGEVTKYDKPYLVVEYEDGDIEDLTEAEVKKILVS